MGSNSFVATGATVRLHREDGRICLTNNAAEKSLRGVALGRKSWLFAWSERGGQRAASMYSLIGTAKLNGIDPKAWLADVIARISEMPVSRLHELVRWIWNTETPPSQGSLTAAFGG